MHWLLLLLLLILLYQFPFLKTCWKNIWDIESRAWFASYPNFGRSKVLSKTGQLILPFYLLLPQSFPSVFLPLQLRKHVIILDSSFSQPKFKLSENLVSLCSNNIQNLPTRISLHHHHCHLGPRHHHCSPGLFPLPPN